MGFYRNYYKDPFPRSQLTKGKYSEHLGGSVNLGQHAHKPSGFRALGSYTLSSVEPWQKFYVQLVLRMGTSTY